MALLNAFRRRNAQSWSLERVRTDLQKAWPEYPDPRNGQHFPAFVRVSLPVYSEDGRVALVYVYGSSDCPGDCGSWAKLLGFVRRSGEWMIVSGGSWIS